MIWTNVWDWLRIAWTILQLAMLPREEWSMADGEIPDEEEWKTGGVG